MYDFSAFWDAAGVGRATANKVLFRRFRRCGSFRTQISARVRSGYGDISFVVADFLGT
jgi:hypothetical protein